MLIITLHLSSCPLISYLFLDNLTKSVKSDNGLRGKHHDFSRLRRLLPGVAVYRAGCQS